MFWLYIENFRLLPYFSRKFASNKSFFNPMGRILMELSVDDALLLGTRFLGGELLFSFAKLVVCHIFLNICLLQLMAAEARLPGVDSRAQRVCYFRSASFSLIVFVCRASLFLSSDGECSFFAVKRSNISLLHFSAFWFPSDIILAHEEQARSWGSELHNLMINRRS